MLIDSNSNIYSFFSNLNINNSNAKGDVNKESKLSDIIKHLSIFNRDQRYINSKRYFGIKINDKMLNNGNRLKISKIRIKSIREVPEYSLYNMEIQISDNLEQNWKTLLNLTQPFFEESFDEIDLSAFTQYYSYFRIVFPYFPSYLKDIQFIGKIVNINKDISLSCSVEISNNYQTSTINNISIFYSNSLSIFVSSSVKEIYRSQYTTVEIPLSVLNEFGNEVNFNYDKTNVPTITGKIFGKSIYDIVITNNILTFTFIKYNNVNSPDFNIFFSNHGFLYLNNLKLYY